MTEREPWMPSDEKARDAFFDTLNMYESDDPEYLEALRALLRAAVEKAVAPWIQAVGLLSTLAGDVPVDVDDPVAMAQEIEASVRRHRARWEAHAESVVRARHAREIEKARLEAKIEALAKFGECYCDGYDFTCDACLTQERARTALAALEGSK